MTTYTPEIRAKLEHYLATHSLPKGLGSEESACSIAAINLAISGKMTDDIPDCMSAVIGRATITLQDAMPDDMRNSDRYKAWLPTAVGTGRDQEQERFTVMTDWMWGTVLPQLQPIADNKGFGNEWQAMCSERNRDAALAAYAAARNADAGAVPSVAYYAADAAAAADVAEVAKVAYAASAADADFWHKVDPIGALERMTNLDEK